MQRNKSQVYGFFLSKIDIIFKVKEQSLFLNIFIRFRCVLFMTWNINSFAHSVPVCIQPAVPRSEHTRYRYIINVLIYSGAENVLLWGDSSLEWWVGAVWINPHCSSIHFRHFFLSILRL